MRVLFLTFTALSLLSACTGPGKHRAPVDERSVGSAERSAVIVRPMNLRMKKLETVQPLPEPTPYTRPGEIGSETSQSDLGPRPVERTDAVSTRYSSKVIPESAGENRPAVSPAVVALLNAANHHERNGDYETAAAEIERALQISPREAWLWHRLARARLLQGHPAQAEHLAAKSNTLAQGNTRLGADNWSLIARARQRQGDHEGARVASDRAAELMASRR